jgi:hypothetical protein
MSAGIPATNRLRGVIGALVNRNLKNEAHYLEEILKRIFVLCHHPELPRHQFSWIDISRRAEIDPGTLAESQTEEFLKEIQQKLWPSENVHLPYI